MSAPGLPHGCGSWIVTRRDTGEAVAELWTRGAADKVNPERYQVHTALDYLVSINGRAPLCA